MSDIHAKESVKQYLTGVVSTITPEIVRSLKRGYTRKDFTSDLMSGLIVGILALPLAIAFAIASGVGPEQGLYTAIIAGFIISLLGGSRFQIGGPTGAFIVIVYGIVSQYGYDGLASATLLAGIFLVIFGHIVGHTRSFHPHQMEGGVGTDSDGDGVPHSGHCAIGKVYTYNNIFHRFGGFKVDKKDYLESLE